MVSKGHGIVETLGWFPELTMCRGSRGSSPPWSGTPVDIASVVGADTSAAGADTSAAGADTSAAGADTRSPGPGEGSSREDGHCGRRGSGQSVGSIMISLFSSCRATKQVTVRGTACGMRLPGRHDLPLILRHGFCGVEFLLVLFMLDGRRERTE